MSVDEQLFYLHCRGTSEKELKFTTGVMSGEFLNYPWKLVEIPSGRTFPPLF